ncbi:MAG: SWIM zinc finger family protein, partial [Pseudomonadota bacterium]
MSRTPFALEAVLALSPDDASTKAARGLVSPGKWPTLGGSDVAVWGECQGSGSKPYQTQVDVSGGGPTFKCSCPSRKFPCKHGLALLLMQAQDASRFTAPEPAWVAEWLASRKERAEKKEIKAATPAAPLDPALAAKREGKRFDRMAAGAQELGLWLDDLARKGLASLSADSQNGASGMAARMVDAQAPGLGQRLTS